MGTQTHLPKNIPQVSPRISATLVLKCCKMQNFILCQEKSYDVLISESVSLPLPIFGAHVTTTEKVKYLIAFQNYIKPQPPKVAAPPKHVPNEFKRCRKMTG